MVGKLIKSCFASVKNHSPGKPSLHNRETVGSCFSSLAPTPDKDEPQGQAASMNDTNPMSAFGDFGKWVPGFEFLKGLTQPGGAPGNSAMPSLGG
jgi:hypothetical protein